MPRPNVNEAPAPAETTAAIEVSRSRRPSRSRTRKTCSLLSEVQFAASGSPEAVVVAGILLALGESALRNVVRSLGEQALQSERASVPIDPNCDEVQQLKSAAMPLLFQLRDDQKEEVRKLARIIGLEKVAQQI